MLRLLPQVTALVEEAWQACQPELGRISLSSYLDYHLSCYHYIQSMEDSQAPIDLIDAFESGIADWISDTEEALKTEKKRVLYFQLFRDSLFELIDLYTPTVDGEKYVGYLKVLVRRVTVCKGGKREIRHRWHKAREPPCANELCEALRKEWAGLDPGEVEAAVQDTYQCWLEAQQCDRGDNEDTTGGSSDESEKDDDVHMASKVNELTPSGFAALCARYVPSAGEQPANDDEARGRVDLFRRFDIDKSGLVSLANFKAVLLDHAPSSWREASSFRRKSSSGLKMMKKVATAARLAKNGGGTPLVSPTASPFGSPTTSPRDSPSELSFVKK